MTNQEVKPEVWPFAFLNGERTKESKELIDSKHYKTRDVFDSSEYEESPF